MSLHFTLFDTGEYGRYALFDRNITHNLVPMWQKAKVYDALYNSDGERASTISAALTAGHAEMVAHKTQFEKLNAPNGWGVYENAIRFLYDTMLACVEYPHAIIAISK